MTGNLFISFISFGDCRLALSSFNCQRKFNSVDIKLWHATATYVCIYILWRPQRTHLEISDYENESMESLQLELDLISY